MSDKKEWREPIVFYSYIHEFGIGLDCDQSAAKFPDELVSLSDYQAEKQRADRLEKENQKLKEALVKISKNDGYLGWRYEDIFKDHKKIAKEALK